MTMGTADLRIGTSGWNYPSGRRTRHGIFYPPSRGHAQGLLDVLAKPNQSDLDEFKRGVDPLVSSGKMGTLLAQFPPSFKSDQPSRDYLAWLLHAFAGYSVAVELRHATWSDSLGDTLA